MPFSYSKLYSWFLCIFEIKLKLLILTFKSLQNKNFHSYFLILSLILKVWSLDHMFQNKTECLLKLKLKFFK